MAEKLKIVEVIWFDSKGMTPDWEHRDEIEEMEPALVTSVGYLLSDQQSYITILQSDSEKQLMGRLTIPRACIDNINGLEIS